MGRGKLITKGLIVIASLFFAGSLFAGTQVADVVKMDNPAYKKHKKQIVTFSHKKHNEQYKAGCGECHHDADNKPLDNLKMGDDVKNCIDCHKKPGEIPGKIKKEFKAKKTPKAEQKKLKLAYHAEAIHYNCKGCHKAYNKKNKTKAAPVTCSKCHPKKKK